WTGLAGAGAVLWKDQGPGEWLPHHAAVAGAEGEPDRELAFAAGGAGDEHVRHVGAGDDEDQHDGAEEKQDRGSQAGGDRLVPVADEDPTVLVGVGIGRLEPDGDVVKLG